jgi:poly(A) polymerase
MEVTTFRGPITDMHERDETGRILSDNAYGTIETDAFRRDFTVNALYYDIRDFAIVDFAGGMDDLKARVLRLIGDPELRYREDPVRMLRAIRIGNKLHFQLDAGAVEPIKGLAPLLREIPPARLFDEVLKLLMCTDAVENFRALHWFGLWAELFPDVEAEMHRSHDATRKFVELALANTEDRLKQNLTVSPAFIFAALLWPVVRARAEALQTGQGHVETVALAQASEEVVARQIGRVAIPKRFSVPAKEIWAMQPRFDMRRGGRAKRLLAHPRFRAAYDFLLLRAQAGEPVRELADWWTAAQEGQPPSLPEGDEQQDPQRRRRRRRRRGGGAHPQAGA